MDLPVSPTGIFLHGPIGEVKVNSKVPPVAQVCGENDGRLSRAGCFRWSFAAQLA